MPEFVTYAVDESSCVAAALRIPNGHCLSGIRLSVDGPRPHISYDLIGIQPASCSSLVFGFWGEAADQFEGCAFVGLPGQDSWFAVVRRFWQVEPSFDPLGLTLSHDGSKPRTISARVATPHRLAHRKPGDLSVSA